MFVCTYEMYVCMFVCLFVYMYVYMYVLFLNRQGSYVPITSARLVGYGEDVKDVGPFGSKSVRYEVEIVCGKKSWKVPRFAFRKRLRFALMTYPCCSFGVCLRVHV
jgi:hypothetical protein